MQPRLRAAGEAGPRAQGGVRGAAAQRGAPAARRPRAPQERRALWLRHQPGLADGGAGQGRGRPREPGEPQVLGQLSDGVAACRPSWATERGRGAPPSLCGDSPGRALQPLSVGTGRECFLPVVGLVTSPCFSLSPESEAASQPGRGWKVLGAQRGPGLWRAGFRRLPGPGAAPTAAAVALFSVLVTPLTS